MAKQRPAWVKDVKVFVGFTLLNGALLIVGVVAYVLNPPSAPAWLDCWMWAFAAPFMVGGRVAHLDPALAIPFLLVNPLLYGLIWWAVWKMVRLLRTKPAD